MLSTRGWYLATIGFAQKLSTCERAAMFVYLNKTCFNGLHRVNRRGEFNVPAGRYTNPRILDEDLLRAASARLQRAELRNAGFEALLVNAKPGDLVYFDPPYAPVSRTASFTAYAQGGFGPDDQERLRDVFKTLDRRRCKLMLSNSDVPFIRELYRDFRIDQVLAPRAINCTVTGTGIVATRAQVRWLARYRPRNAFQAANTHLRQSPPAGPRCARRRGAGRLSTRIEPAPPARIDGARPRPRAGPW